MKKLNYLLLSMLVAVSVLVLESCKKDPIPTPVELPDFDSSDDENSAESEMNDAFAIAEEAMKKNNSSMRTLSDTSCATITLTTADSTILVNFADSTCVGKDGKKRFGTIRIKYTGKYRDSATVITTTFENYYVNGNKVEGKKVVQNMGNRTYKITVTNGKITFKDGTFITWVANRTRVWTAGYDTPFNLTDDTYTINGTSSGVSRKGKNFEVTLTDIVVKLECWFQTPRVFYPVSGKKLVKNTTDNKNLYIDFGTGNCDKQITATTDDGVIHNITLK